MNYLGGLGSIILSTMLVNYSQDKSQKAGEEVQAPYLPVPLRVQGI